MRSLTYAPMYGPTAARQIIESACVGNPHFHDRQVRDDVTVTFEHAQHSSKAIATHEAGWVVATAWVNGDDA